MALKNYYKVLGVSKTASLKQIKSAYRKLAPKYHPDVSDDPDGEAKFKELGEAYEVLKDEVLRASYDQQWADMLASSISFNPIKLILNKTTKGNRVSGTILVQYPKDVFQGTPKARLDPPVFWANAEIAVFPDSRASIRITIDTSNCTIGSNRAIGVFTIDDVERSFLVSIEVTEIPAPPEVIFEDEEDEPEEETFVTSKQTASLGEILAAQTLSELWPLLPRSIKRVSIAVATLLASMLVIILILIVIAPIPAILLGSLTVNRQYVGKQSSNIEWSPDSKFFYVASREETQPHEVVRDHSGEVGYINGEYIETKYTGDYTLRIFDGVKAEVVFNQVLGKNVEKNTESYSSDSKYLVSVTNFEQDGGKQALLVSIIDLRTFKSQSLQFDVEVPMFTDSVRYVPIWSKDSQSFLVRNIGLTSTILGDSFLLEVNEEGTFSISTQNISTQFSRNEWIYESHGRYMDREKWKGKKSPIDEQGVQVSPDGEKLIYYSYDGNAYYVIN